MLVDTWSKRYIIVLTPSTKGMKQKDWVFVTLLDQLLTGVLEEKNVSIMEGITNLEGVDGISATIFNKLFDFSRSVSVLVHAVVESDTFGEVHARS